MLEVICFTGKDCKPCEALKPVLKEVTDAYKVKLTTFDRDQYRELASSYGIYSVPNTLFLSKNKVITSRVGFITKKDIANILDEIISKEK